MIFKHEQSTCYDLAGFKAGKERLRSIELFELGDVTGRSLLHLQCHFGLDTLAWELNIYTNTPTPPGKIPHDRRG